MLVTGFEYSPCNRRGRNSATIPEGSEACHNGGQPLSAEACALCTHSCSWARGSRAAKRDEIKRALHEAYATAKELGEEVAVTRRSVGELRQALAAGGGGGGDAAAEEEEAAGSLRLRLQLDTAAYKDAVAQLRELKPQIGGLQQQMQRIQQQLEADFADWHACAVAAAAG